MTFNDTITVGRWPPRAGKTESAIVPVSNRLNNMLLTRGAELITPQDYRASFEIALERAVIAGGNLADEQKSRAYAASSTAYSCTEYRVSTTAACPLIVRAADTDEILEDTPLEYFINNSENIIADIVRSLLLWGRCYLRKQRNKKGWPTGLEYINPVTVREQVNDVREVVRYDVRQPNGSVEELSVSEVVYIQLFDPTPLGQGVSKFQAAWRAIGVEQGIVTFAAAFFVNSAQPDGFLTFEEAISDEQYTEARNQWAINFKGVRNAHRTAVMPGGARWNPIQAAPKDLAMAELKETEREDICTIFEVDPILIGLKGVADPLSANSTYSTSEVAHVRRVTLPFLRSVILHALNKQWAYRDFGQKDYYCLHIDESGIAVLADANLVRSETAINITKDNIADYEEGRKLIGMDEPRKDYLKRSPIDALSMWEKGAIPLGTFHKLVGTPGIKANDPNLNVIMIGGQLLPYTELASVAAKNVEKLTQPPPAPLLPSGNNGSDNPPPDKPKELPASEADNGSAIVQRSDMPLTIAISFANHQFVRYARRILSDALTQANINGVEWVADSDWRISLQQFSDWNPNAVSKLLRSADYTDTRKLDLKATGYHYGGDSLYLSVEGDLSGFSKALAIDSQNAGLNAKNSDLRVGIEIARHVDTQLATLPAVSYPLVAGNITLYIGDTLYHEWQLRGVSGAQTKELAAWRKAVGNKGAGYAFTTEALTGSRAATFVRDALALEVEADEQAEWVTTVFETAGELLKSETVRAYADTRGEFYDTILGLIKAAQAEESTRPSFAGKMRAALRKYGLIAFRDGMADAGYNPESLSPDEIAVFRDWQAQQSAYVTGFGSELFKEGGITENEVAIRADMWSNVSLLEIYYRGLAAGNSEKRYEWVVDLVAEHCTTCMKLRGQVHSIKEWLDSGFIPGHNTECKQGCKCGLAPTSKAKKGKFAA